MIHGDIKARNILLDSDFQPRVVDFGLTKIISNDVADSIKEKGTLAYLAPEYVMLGRASKSSDVYSFGIALLELVSGRIAQLTHGMNHSIIDWAHPLVRKGNFREIADPKLDFNEEELRRVVLVAFMSTQKQPERRPSMLEVVELLKGEAGDKPAKLEGALCRNWNWQSAADDKDENSEDREV